MTIVLLVAAAVLLIGVALVHAVLVDGYGQRPPPRSHRDWTEDAPRP